ncbi:myeloid differentiation primary response protein MyD88-like [Saccostrea echinata]|uniref:myeloid differentiation primary response protein MyD88-like n=1 Tax=Saccostrea echinata TaxID=191078 RepID=UPI002A82AE30|nr:myeloid differentiation primary response protein MyD88-like [Saccostrea echinata]
MGSVTRQYDAYVIADDTEEDRLFLQEMADNLESSEHNLRLHIRSRDGDIEMDYQKESEIIMNGCEKVIVVLTKKFTKNEIAMYLLKVAVSRSPGFQMRHIIPIHREECIAPSCIRFLTANDYTKSDLRPWFWPRVAMCFRKQARPFTSISTPRKVKKNLADVVCLPDIIMDSFSSVKENKWRTI